MKIDELVEWCWKNLEFYNNPETWENTYINDIINGYQGDCHDKNGKAWKYSDIRFMFRGE